LGHDLWLVPAVFQLDEAREFNLSVHVGHPFPVGDSTLDQDRIARFVAISRNGATQIDEYSEQLSFLSAAFKPSGAGEHVILLETKRKYLILKPDVFNLYLEKDGLPEILEKRRREVLLATPGRELYTRSVKTFVRVGHGDPEGLFTLPVGSEIELVPRSDPLALVVGDLLEFRLLAQGQALAAHPVQAGSETERSKGSPHQTVTDEQGRGAFRLDREGMWFVRTIHMVPAGQNADGARWRSYWAMMTFEVGPPKEPPLPE